MTAKHDDDSGRAWRRHLPLPTAAAGIAGIASMISAVLPGGTLLSVICAVVTWLALCLNRSRDVVDRTLIIAFVVFTNGIMLQQVRNALEWP